MPQRRILSEAEFNAVRDRVLQALPPNLSEDDFNRVIGSRMDQALAEAEYQPAPTEGGAASRFLSNAGEMLNPLTMAEGVYNTVRHPIDTASAVVGQMAQEGRTAAQALREGDYGRALGHGMAAAVPLVGPIAAQAGEQIADGDIAGGLGKAAGILAPFGAAATVRGAARVGQAVTPTRLAEGAANWLDKSAVKRVVDVMAPKVGANKTRFGGMAEEAAPELLKRGEAGAWSREGLQDTVQTGLSKSVDALDAASDARMTGRAFPTQPLIDDLLKKRRALTSESVEGSKPTRVESTRTSALVDEYGKPIQLTEQRAQPIGSDVVPGPNAARVAQIDQAIAEIKELGSIARYESLRRIRQAYDGPAKAKYNPSTTADFLKAQGGASGAADVTGVLREHLAKFDPETATANAEYALYKRANDVLDATAEIERVRPRVGRQIMARLTGATVGGQAAGAVGAAGGFVLGPVLDSVMSTGATTKLQTAQTFAKLADAIRKGDMGRVNSLSAALQSSLRKASAGAQVGRATSPSESPSPTTAPALAPSR